MKGPRCALLQDLLERRRAPRLGQGRPNIDTHFPRLLRIWEHLAKYDPNNLANFEVTFGQKLAKSGPTRPILANAWSLLGQHRFFSQHRAELGRNRAKFGRLCSKFGRHRPN